MGTPLEGKTLIKCQIRQQTSCSVIAIKTQGTLNINPAPSIALGENDELVLIGDVNAEKLFLKNYRRA